MADEIDAATEAAVLIPEIWDPLVMPARYQAAKIAKRVTSKDAKVSAFGDKVHLPIQPSMTISDITQTDGTVANQALTYTEASITINKWRGTKITIVDMATWQSIVDMSKDLAPAFAKTLAFDIDDALAALYGSFTTNDVGDGATEYSGELLLAGLQKLINLSVPVDVMDDITCVIHNSKWSVLKNIDKFSFANYTGATMGGQMKYETPAPYAIPHFFTNAIDASSSVYQNMLFHRQALGLAVQKGVMVKELPPTGFNKIIQAGVLYGVKAVRENHLCLIKTK